MTNNPLVSIITVCLNSAKTIRLTIESVLMQSYDNYEYIIKDGGSTDETLTIIEEYRDIFGKKLKVIRESDTGIYNAMNQGIKACRGEIIGIINSDDYYDSNTIKDVVERYQKEQYEYLIVIGDMEKVTEAGQTVYRYKFTEEMVKKKGCFGHPSMFAAKAVYDLVGLYDETYKLAADGDWQYRAMYNPDVKVILSHQVYNHMREGGASDNPKYRWMWFRERTRLERAYNRGSYLGIFLREVRSLIRTDIKSITPDRLKKYLYKVRYKRSGE